MRVRLSVPSTWLRTGWLVLLLVLLPRLGWADSPTETTRRLIELMRAYKDASVPSLDHSRSLQRIEENLAIAELAEWFLGPHWEKIGAQEQQNFTELLTRFLREIAYPNAAKFLGDVRVEYGSEQVNGSEALVETTAVQPKEGQVSLGYRLRQIQGKWMVWDVLLDGVSMATNLRSQIRSMIAKKSYQEMINRMQEKLNQEMVKRMREKPEKG